MSSITSNAADNDQQHPQEKRKRSSTVSRGKPAQPPIEALAMKIPAAARAMNLGITTTKALVHSGRIYSMKIGSTRLVPVWAIRKFLGDRDA
jgi:hypothetical protein